VKRESKMGEKAPARAGRREALLEQTAVTVGRNWVDQCRHDLHREGRAAAGGWPGTLREARIRMQRYLGEELTRDRIADVTDSERELLARRAYASARTEWFLKVEPDDEGP
jgi:hypothetical protein